MSRRSIFKTATAFFVGTSAPAEPDPSARIPVLDLAPEIALHRAELDAAFARVLNAGTFILGAEVAAFEAEAAATLGVRHAIGVANGTDALVIALRALGVGPGDEVITTPFSFFATAESISTLGARPVFVDIDEATMNLDVARVEAAITPRTRAILPVHLFGRMVEMAPLLEIARRRGLVVVEDVAQAMGATQDGRRAGSFGHASTFSFFPSKTLGGFGDGGMIATDDDRVAEAARMLRAHGARVKYRNEVVGYNSRLDTLQAALLRVKLPHLDAATAARRAAARRYADLLGGTDGLVLPVVGDGHAVHQFTVRIAGGAARRDAVQAAMFDAGIDTMVYYPVPQDQLPVYAGRYAPAPVSARFAGEVLSLPIWPAISPETQARVADALRAALSSVPVASEGPTPDAPAPAVAASAPVDVDLPVGGTAAHRTPAADGSGQAFTGL